MFHYKSRQKWPHSLVVASQLLLLALCAPLARAERVQLLSTDAERLAGHFDVIDNARNEIDAAFAYFHDDEVGHAFLAHLVAAASPPRNVKVKLLLDGVNVTLPRELVAFLHHNGVEIRYYHLVGANPKTWKNDVSWIWRRMHDKVLSADGWRMVGGTENIGIPYYKRLYQSAKRGFTGRNLLVEGQVAADAQTYFKRVWDSAEVTSPLGSMDLLPEQWAREERLLAAASARTDELLKTGRAPSSLTPAFSVAPDKIEFVSKLDDETGGPHGLRRRLVEMLEGAQKRIVIETPYLYPDQQLIDILARKASQDRIPGGVTIYTNSVKANNHPVGNPLYQDMAEKLRGMGIRVEEWPGPDTAHGKTYLVDDDKVLETSHNLNLRSIKVDSESGVYIESADAVRVVEADIRTEKYGRASAALGPFAACLRALFKHILLPTRNQW